MAGMHHETPELHRQGQDLREQSALSEPILLRIRQQNGQKHSRGELGVDIKEHAARAKKIRKKHLLNNHS